MNYQLLTVVRPPNRVILTNRTLYDQHYVTAISESPTGLSQTIVALAAMLLLIDIPFEIIFG